MIQENLSFGPWRVENIMYINISSVVEFQRWWVLKSKLFGQESTCHQGKIFKKILRVMTVCQKVPKSYFQSQFWMSKINRIFSKKKLSKNINLGDHYLLKAFFSKLNFWTTLLSKITPNFWQTVITRRNFLKIFPWWHVDSWPKTLLFRTHHL